ncbi:MAG: protein kinase [Acidobacteria bacterium]|nr:protein kinase [Acidobacteriota bacterium]
MTPERWQQIDRLLNEVLERQPSERAGFLAQAANGDDELRREVDSLLKFHGQSENFIEAPPAEIAADWIQQIESRADNTIGHYQLIREIGRGGMGIVYLANDTRLGRQVALKLLLEKLTQDAARVRRFQREARAVSALNHPNIITVYEVGQAEHEHYIAAEFVDGKTLREICKSGGLVFNQALDVLLQTCAALTSAHEAGIIHRDIKPENIMLRPDGIVKVLDFGLAKLIEQAPRPNKEAQSARLTTQPGMVMGTTSYMSPEQARGLNVDARSDLFSLGVVMYELLTGQAPFRGETTADVLAALLMGEPRPLDRFSPKLPTALQNIVNRCLSKSVEERYQSARDIGNDLKQLKDELEFSARLKGRSVKDDEILTMTVGAIEDASQQTTFATRAAENLSTAFSPTQPQKRKTSPDSRFKQVTESRLGKLAMAIVLLATVAALGWWKFKPYGKPIDSIAVLPLVNQLDDAQLDYVPDGITETLIDGLSQLPDLTVRPSSMVLAYKGRETDVRQIGKDLKVDAVVTGQVKLLGEQFIVQLELIRTENGSRLWDQTYEAKPDAILAIQQEISEDLTKMLRQQTTDLVRSQTAKRQTQNSEAHKLYIIGHNLWLKRNSDSTLKAIEKFEQAIKLDNNYALAYVGIADAYSTMGSYRQGRPHDVYPKALEAAEKALSLDPQLAEAHASLGKILTDYSWDWAKAEAEFRTAISLKPNYANAHHWYSTLLATIGRFDDAIREVKIAQGLDFLSPATNTHVGNIFYRARRYDEAIAALKEALELEPNFIAARFYLGMCYLKQKRFEMALAEFQTSKQAVPNSSEALVLLALTYSEMGKLERTRQCLSELREVTKSHYASSVSFGIIHAALGEMDKAFEYMNQAFEEGAPVIRGLKTDPLFDNMRQDPRFAGLMRRAGLTP